MKGDSDVVDLCGSGGGFFNIGVHCVVDDVFGQKKGPAESTKSTQG
jgi:hypothetical protein